LRNRLRFLRGADTLHAKLTFFGAHNFKNLQHSVAEAAGLGKQSNFFVAGRFRMMGSVHSRHTFRLMPNELGAIARLSNMIKQRF
jgi:hypothetical protein